METSFQNKSYSQMSESPQVTLFMAFYNNVQFFKKVFTSVEIQTFKSFELIICDDGSATEATQNVRQIIEDSKIPVKIVWHPDRGFYKNEALNRGLRLARAEYLVFIDADCVLHPQFIEDHWSLKKESHTLAGRRADLTPLISKNLTEKRIRENYLQKNWWWLLFFMFWFKDNNWPKGLRISSTFLFKLLNKKQRGLVGCNFSVHKKDLLAVNGFDMSYTKPGIGEDSDIDFRLTGLGITPLPMCYRGIQYHLYHKLLPRSNENELKFAELKISKKFVTANGLAQLK